MFNRHNFSPQVARVAASADFYENHLVDFNYVAIGAGLAVFLVEETGG